MSIEENLATLAKNSGRIADALEALAAAAAGITAPAAEAPADKPAATRKRAPAKAEEPAPEPEPEAEVEDDGLGLDDEPEEEQPETFTEDQVRKALKNFRDINGAAATMAILDKDGGGATGMGNLKPEFYAAVMGKVR